MTEIASYGVSDVGNKTLKTPNNWKLNQSKGVEARVISSNEIQVMILKSLSRLSTLVDIIAAAKATATQPGPSSEAHVSE